MENAKIKTNPNYVLRDIAGQSVLITTGNGVADFCGIINLNTSAAVLWKKLQMGATSSELIQLLIDTFAITKEVAEADVKKTLALLEEHKMITYGEQ